MRVSRTTILTSVAALVVASTAAGCSSEAATEQQPAAPLPGRDVTVVEAPAWETAEPAALGLRTGRLERLARQARRLDSTCYAVVRDGKLAGEWNWRSEATAPREVFSVTKSITSALVGIAVRDGDLSPDERVARHVPRWRGTAASRVRVRHLLSNDSGRFWSSRSDYGDLLQAGDRTRFAVRLRQQHPPGQAWAYNNAAIQVLEAVLSSATRMPVEEFAQERLFEPLGMTSTRMTLDGAGNAQTFYGVQSTCLDLARFGQLYLDEGTVDGTRLLSRGWVRRSTRPSTPHNAAYGWLWWLNRSGPLRGALDPVDADGQPVSPRRGQLAPGAPAGLFAAQGLGGQTVLVDPASRTVVVRLGALSGDEDAFGFATAARVVTEALR